MGSTGPLPKLPNPDPRCDYRGTTTINVNPGYVRGSTATNTNDPDIDDTTTATTNRPT